MNHDSSKEKSCLGSWPFWKCFHLTWTKGASKGAPIHMFARQEYESLAKSIHPQPSSAISKLTSLGWILAYVQLLTLAFGEEQKGKAIRQLLPEPPRIPYLILNDIVLVLPIEVISWKASNSSELSSLTPPYKYGLYPKIMVYKMRMVWEPSLHSKLGKVQTNRTCFSAPNWQSNLSSSKNGFCHAKLQLWGCLVAINPRWAHPRKWLTKHPLNHWGYQYLHVPYQLASPILSIYSITRKEFLFRIEQPIDTKCYT